MESQRFILTGQIEGVGDHTAISFKWRHRNSDEEVPQPAVNHGAYNVGGPPKIHLDRSGRFHTELLPTVGTKMCYEITCWKPEYFRPMGGHQQRYAEKNPSRMIKKPPTGKWIEMPARNTDLMSVREVAPTLCLRLRRWIHRPAQHDKKPRHWISRVLRWIGDKIVGLAIGWWIPKP